MLREEPPSSSVLGDRPALGPKCCLHRENKKRREPPSLGKSGPSKRSDFISFSSSGGKSSGRISFLGHPPSPGCVGRPSLSLPPHRLLSTQSSLSPPPPSSLFFATHRPKISPGGKREKKKSSSLTFSSSSSFHALWTPPIFLGSDDEDSPFATIRQSPPADRRSRRRKKDEGRNWSSKRKEGTKWRRSVKTTRFEATPSRD